MLTRNRMFVIGSARNVHASAYKPAYRRPGLRMPCGSSAAFTRRVMRASGPARPGSHRPRRAAVPVAQQHPGAAASPRRRLAPPRGSRRLPAPASHTSPPPQSRKPRAPQRGKRRSTLRPAEGRTETRQTASSGLGAQTAPRRAPPARRRGSPRRRGSRRVPPSSSRSRAVR